MNRSIIGCGGVCAGISALVWLCIPIPARAEPQTEAARVIQEACGEDPTPGCVADLRKVCHKKMTMRCYLSRKRRFDARHGTSESPEGIDERDDRSIFYDE